MGIFQIDNPIKAKAIDAIRDWNRAGIGFRLITGDNKNAAKLIAVKLFPDQSLTIYDSESLNHLENWQTRDLAQATVIFTDTKSETLEILDRLDNMGSQKPNIIFCQMKDVDKKILVDHAKTQGLFIIANGDGCNDILMLKSAHISIGDAALDGSFSRGVKEASTFTDLQLGQLMKSEKKTLYQLLDLHKGKESVFLNHFAPIANTQPKIISALVCKCLKSAAIPKMLGLFTREIPHQFSLMLAYDAIFFAAIHQASMATASITFVAEPISHSYIPIVAMIFSVALAALQSGYCYYYQNEQITTMPLLVTNLFVSIGGLYFFMAPPGYAPKKRIKNESLAISEQIVITPRSRAYSTF
jgi:Ca2+-transporting ATPase